tara:strand:- start:681 stop:950 length:270 start_codon:yes stop_codon:yes gene_type:complete
MKSQTTKYAATILYIGAAFLAGSLFYQGQSNHRLSESNKALSSDIQKLIEAYTFSEKDFCLLAPAPDDWLIWEEMPYRMRDTVPLDLQS